MSNKIRVVVFREDEFWVAQALEHDICVQAENLDDLYGRFEITAQLEAKEPGGLERIAPAPQHFFELWDKQAGGYKPKQLTETNFQFAVAA